MTLRVPYHKLNFLIIKGIILSYPFSVRICNTLVIFLLVNWLFWLREKQFSFKNSNWIFVISCPVIIMLISLLYSENLNAGFYSIEKRLPYCIFPIILGTIPPLSQLQIRSILKWTLGVCFLSILIFLVLALYNYLLTNKIDTFYWKNLTSKYSFHPSYYSIFILFCLFIVFLEYSSSKKSIKKLYVGGVAIFILVIILLSSKLYVLLSLISIIYFCLIIIKNPILKYSFIVVIFILFLFAFQNTNLKERFDHINTINYRLDDPSTNFNELTIRLALIECSIDIIKNNALLGVGIGDMEEALMNTYYKYDYKFGYLDKQNPHNQYLSILVSTGLIGFLFFMGSLILPLYISVKRNNYLYVLLLSTFLISFTVESSLERQKGIILFYLFSSLLFFHPINSTANVKIYQVNHK